MWDVPLQQRNDPRAMFMLWQLEDVEERATELLQAAAVAGYAPAQARLSIHCVDENNYAEGFVWATRAAEQGDRTCWAPFIATGSAARTTQ
jgi:TPR repeat protein